MSDKDLERVTTAIDQLLAEHDPKAMSDIEFRGHRYDAGLAWVLVVVVPVVAVVFMFIMRGAVPLFQVMQTRIDRLNLVIAEGLSGVRVIRAFDRAQHQHDRFDQANLATMETAVRVNRIVAFLMPSMMVLLNVTSIALVYSLDVAVRNEGAVLARFRKDRDVGPTPDTRYRPVATAPAGSRSGSSRSSAVSQGSHDSMPSNVSPAAKRSQCSRPQGSDTISASARARTSSVGSNSRTGNTQASSRSATERWSATANRERRSTSSPHRSMRTGWSAVAG